VLAAAEHTRLTLVSAPAGTGKTTVVADWARQLVLRAPTGWVTFEEDTALWPDLLGCLGRLGVAVPELRASEGGVCAISRSQLTTVAEGVAASPERLTVVLDGYELLGADEARDLGYLLEHSLGRLGLVLVTRVDPVLPLYRYRLDGGLTELRVADLAFTDQEAGVLLHDAGVALDPASVRAVNARVRGWAAGLRFAARALADDRQPRGASAAAVTAGADVNEYLLGEVLDVQTPEVRRFLLDSSVADVLSPSLVTTLCGPEAHHLLTSLAHLNAFAEPVPGQPGCYRYYPFFKELLQAQLAYEQPRRWAELHAAAATWCRNEGLPDRALTHLAAIEAWPAVAELLLASDQVSVLLSEGTAAGPALCASTLV
jgi:LuxR family maltose regulon positive regulatory protein